MSPTVLIAINVALDAAVLGALPFVMSHASRLTPHEGTELTSSASARSYVGGLSDPPAERSVSRVVTASDAVGSMTATSAPAGAVLDANSYHDRPRGRTRPTRPI